MLKRVKIVGYKSLRNVEVELHSLTTLFGPNSAGKSNFLDALQLLSNIAKSRTLREAFEPPYRGKPLESFSFESGGVEALLKQDSAKFSIEVDVELSECAINEVNRALHHTMPSVESLTSSIIERHLRYRIEIEVNPRSGFLRVSDEYLSAIDEYGNIDDSKNPFLWKEKNDHVRLRFELLNFTAPFKNSRDYAILSFPHFLHENPHVAVMRAELANWFFFYLEPRDRMRATNPVKEVRHIGMMGEDLAAFLNTLKAVNERQFRSIEKSLQTIIPSITGIDVSVNNSGEVELRVIEDGIPIPARLLSEGTLRILGLLAIGGAESPPSLLAFEEPENGVHPRRMRLIAEILRQRAASSESQIIVTTHSPLMADLMPREGLLQTRRTPEGTVILPIAPDATREDIDDGIEDDDEPTLISERIIRGDFDA